ncbi:MULTISPECIES: tryptophan-rich sensory protein [unclassified Polaribacter]|uniref:tryptophan-rich sensory protein n=1 Tax=unclassified Polaribacter TaxID=196858 RepID=UPI0011BD4F35|nr:MULTISPECIES: tryptophan-rich sensory protein [unclassified Polaribacter]TXD51367.1 tryptophan-rich sensory protein [Polaribacter sp. IC063]TXD62001.1 tryptophan-rich sensory protein [Polaribacter sp. IC066]
MKKILQIGNGIAFVSVVFINYLSNTGLLNNTTIGEISRDLNSLFTPAGYAFSIWGLIYLLLLGFAIYQGRSLFVKVKNDDFVEKTGIWFILSCVANAAWIFCWIYEYTGLSCIFIFLLLFSLLKIVWNNKMELWDAPFSVILFLWWPFVIYSGWVTVASIANVSSYLVKIDWNGFGISAEIWTLIMIVIATAINLSITWKRNMREFALVGAWALIAIGVANNNDNSMIANSAFFTAAILIISSAAHAFKNRSTNPVKKMI